MFSYMDKYWCNATKSSPVAHSYVHCISFWLWALGFLSLNTPMRADVFTLIDDLKKKSAVLPSESRSEEVQIEVNHNVPRLKASQWGRALKWEMKPVSCDSLDSFDLLKVWLSSCFSEKIYTPADIASGARNCLSQIRSSGQVNALPFV